MDSCSTSYKPCFVIHQFWYLGKPRQRQGSGFVLSSGRLWTLAQLDLLFSAFQVHRNLRDLLRSLLLFSPTLLQYWRRMAFSKSPQATHAGLDSKGARVKGLTRQDEADMAEQGKRQRFNRNFGFISMLGFTTTSMCNFPAATKSS
jgi:hypothetical protein